MRPTKLLAAALPLLVAFSACTQDDVPIRILQNQVPEEGCVIPAARTTTFRGSGLIDTNATNGYVFTPVVINYGSATGAPAGTRLFAAEGADVELAFQEGVVDEAALAELEAANLTKFSVPFSGTIEPDQGTSSFAFVIVPLGVLDALAPLLAESTDRILVEAQIEVFGEYAGRDIETPPFYYPVQVCNGCMTVDVGSCATLPSDFTASQGGECNLLQDVPLECCNDGAGGLTCPASAPE